MPKISAGAETLATLSDELRERDAQAAFNDPAQWRRNDEGEATGLIIWEREFFGYALSIYQQDGCAEFAALNELEEWDCEWSGYLGKSTSLEQAKSVLWKAISALLLLKVFRADAEGGV
jgi:hypothetical protein